MAEEQVAILSGEIHIIATPDGRMSISAPGNTVLALGLIEVAKADIIRRHQANMQELALKQRATGILKVDGSALKGLPPVNGAAR